MNREYPIELPFGIRLAACHGLPMLVIALAVGVICFGITVAVSRMLPPVTLTSIWLEPRHVTVGQVVGQEPVKMAKAGFWTRLCPSYAIQTFFDEHGNEMLHGGKHRIDVPKAIGPIEHTPRPITIPKILANAPGVYKVRLDDYSVCWPWERLWPIYSTSVEATFEITAQP